MRSFVVIIILATVISMAHAEFSINVGIGGGHMAFAQTESEVNIDSNHHFYGGLHFEKQIIGRLYGGINLDYYLFKAKLNKEYDEQFYCNSFTKHSISIPLELSLKKGPFSLYGGFGLFTIIASETEFISQDGYLPSSSHVDKETQITTEFTAGLRVKPEKSVFLSFRVTSVQEIEQDFNDVFWTLSLGCVLEQ